MDDPEQMLTVEETLSALEAAARTKIGNRYVLLEPVGTGSIGFVYRALDERLERTVAVKVLSAEFDYDQDTRRRFNAEARLSSTFNHPNVATTYDYDYGIECEQSPYIVMEFVDGLTLEAMLKTTGAMELDAFLPILKQICDGLNHAHKKGVIHRDLKPGNVIITKDDSARNLAKIVDFGFARALFTNDTNRLTRDGEILGTPLYMSPEQISDKDIDERTDIYSLGCLMFECIAGHVPFQGPNAVATAKLHVLGLIPPLPQLPDAKRGELMEAVIHRCLQKDRNDRYASVLELSADVEALLTGKDLSARTKEFTADSGKRKGPQCKIWHGARADKKSDKMGGYTLIMLAAIVLACLIFIAAIFIFNQQPHAGQ